MFGMLLSVVQNKMIVLNKRKKGLPQGSFQCCTAQTTIFQLNIMRVSNTEPYFQACLLPMSIGW